MTCDITFSQHGSFEGFATGGQYRSVAIEAMTICCNHPDIAELGLVEQVAHSREVGSLVLSEIFEKHLKADAPASSAAHSAFCMQFNHMSTSRCTVLRRTMGQAFGS